MRQKTFFLVFEGLPYGENEKIRKKSWTQASRNGQKYRNFIENDFN